MHVYRRSIELSLIVVVGCAIVLLAVASSGRAGSVLPADALEAAVEPQFLTTGEEGVVFGKFTTPSGSGTGSATGVVMTFHVDSDLLNQNSTTCTQVAATEQGFNRWDCSLGTVNAGTSEGAFVNFTGPAFDSTPPVNNVYQVMAVVSADGGKGKGGGGSSATNTITDTTEVVETVNGRRAGNCTGDASTADGDEQDTTLTGSAGSSVATCPWVFVGENDAPNNAGLRSQISFWGFPVTDSDAPAVWKMNLDLPSGPFNQLKVYYLENYSPEDPDVSKEEFVACETDSTPIPDGETACLSSWVKVGNRGYAEGYVEGTGGDPGAGVG